MIRLTSSSGNRQVYVDHTKIVSMYQLPDKLNPRLITQVNLDTKWSPYVMVIETPDEIYDFMEAKKNFIAGPRTRTRKVKP